MRRGLLLTCLWVLGVTASISLSFAAVGRVANRVASPGVGRLSDRAVDRALGSPLPPSPSTTPMSSRETGTPASTAHPSSTTTTTETGHGSVPSTTVGSSPPTTARAGPGTSVPASVPPPPTTQPTAQQNTVTTSQGGTVWTRCSGSEQIVYVAAIPKSGYERTRDVENPGGIVQWFENDTHVSRISAECSDGVVHAEVEEESRGDYAPGGNPADQSST